MRLLAIGDVVGQLGRATVAQVLPNIRRQYSPDLVIANGENAAGGKGLTFPTAQDLLRSGVDVISSGNHIWAQKDASLLLESDLPILRPLNYPPGAPGQGVLTHDGVTIFNLMGRTFMPGDLDCPFRTADQVLSGQDGPGVVVLDLHAEATSEKTAMAWYLDGRVSVVFGTHTHVATADARIFPKGTAYVTDLGMVGALNSVIGVETEAVLERFLSQLPVRFTPVEKGPSIFNSVLIDINEVTGTALSIERVDRQIP